MGEKHWALARGFLIGSGFVALQVYFLPRWFDLPRAQAGAWQAPGRLSGLVPVALGLLLITSCFWRFGAEGLGTPAPFDPPRRLVTHGPYRYVRNPMYLGMAMVLLGEALLLAEFRAELLVYGGVLVVVTMLFVRLYEEPTLRRTFGAEYEQYCREVPRWMPRFPGRTSPTSTRSE